MSQDWLMIEINGISINQLLNNLSKDSEYG